MHQFLTLFKRFFQYVDKAYLKKVFSSFSSPYLARCQISLDVDGLVYFSHRHCDAEVPQNKIQNTTG